MLKDLFSHRWFPAGLLFCVLIVVGSTLYYAHVKRETEQETERTRTTLEHTSEDRAEQDEPKTTTEPKPHSTTQPLTSETPISIPGVFVFDPAAPIVLKVFKDLDPEIKAALRHLPLAKYAAMDAQPPTTRFDSEEWEAYPLALIPHIEQLTAASRALDNQPNTPENWDANVALSQELTRYTNEMTRRNNERNRVRNEYMGRKTSK